MMTIFVGQRQTARPSLDVNRRASRQPRRGSNTPEQDGRGLKPIPPG
jgi:hypothetical protein